jgi:hypothetical protein
MTNTTPHRAPDDPRLALVLELKLRHLIPLRRANTVPGSRLDQAGIPPLLSLEAERQRRERSRVAAAS